MWTQPLAAGDEASHVEIRCLAFDNLRHQMRRDGREHDAVAIVSGGDEVSGDGSFAEERQIVGSGGTQAGPSLEDARFAELRNKQGGGLMKALDDFGIDLLAEASFFERAAYDESSIAARDDVAKPVGSDDVAELDVRWLCGRCVWEHQGEHLSFDGTRAEV